MRLVVLLLSVLLQNVFSLMRNIRFNILPVFCMETLKW